MHLTANESQDIGGVQQMKSSFLNQTQYSRSNEAAFLTICYREGKHSKERLED